MRLVNRLPYLTNQTLISPKITGDLTLSGGGSITTTLNGDLTLNPHGTGSIISCDNINASKIITFNTSLYVRTIPIPLMSAFDSGDPYPRKIGITNGCCGGWILDDRAKILGLKTRIYSDWDGVSDPWLSLTGESGIDNSGGGVDDHSDVWCTIRHKADGETAWKYVIAAAIFAFGKAQLYQQKTTTCLIDYDKVDHLLLPNSNIAISLMQETNTSTLDTFILTGATLCYLTKEINPVAP